MRELLLNSFFAIALGLLTCSSYGQHRLTVSGGSQYTWFTDFYGSTSDVIDRFDIVDTFNFYAGSHHSGYPADSVTWKIGWVRNSMAGHCSFNTRIGYDRRLGKHWGFNCGLSYREHVVSFELILDEIVGNYPSYYYKRPVLFSYKHTYRGIGGYFLLGYNSSESKRVYISALFGPELTYFRLYRKKWRYGELVDHGIRGRRAGSCSINLLASLPLTVNISEKCSMSIEFNYRYLGPYVIGGNAYDYTDQFRHSVGINLGAGFKLGSKEKD